jgi:hypothetical protein
LVSWDKINTNLDSSGFPSIKSQLNNQTNIASNYTKDINASLKIRNITQNIISITYISAMQNYSKNYTLGEFSYDLSLSEISLNITGIEYSPTGKNILYFSTSISSPSIKIISPLDGQQMFNNLKFVFNASDNINISGCSLYYRKDGVFTSYNKMDSVTNAQDYTLEITSVNSQHVLYSDDLQWFISCNNTVGVQANSTISHLDTKEDVPPSSGGGGGGGGIIPSGNITQLPKSIDLEYPSIWKIGENIRVTIKSYNQNNEIYIPPKVTFDYSIEGLILGDYEKINDRIVQNFQVGEDAETGEKEIMVNVKDERSINYLMKFAIEEKQITEKTLQAQVQSILNQAKKPMNLTIIIIVLISICSLIIWVFFYEHRKKYIVA